MIPGESHQGLTICHSPQGRSHGSDGRELLRWFVYIDDGKRVTSWAATAEEARTKTIERRGCTVHRVDPAPCPPEDR
jgi:hypothetical protein